MKTKLNQRVYYKLIGLMVVVWTLTLNGCFDGQSNNNQQVNSPSNSSASVTDRCEIGSVLPRSKYIIESGNINQIANEVSKDAGKIIASANGRTDRMIFVFEETHTSRLGQLEIALMLLRLQSKHNLRQISLEGAIADQNDLSAKWFDELGNSQIINEAKEKVATRLLNEGEINSGEFISLISQDVEVKGNERADEYSVTMSEKASVATAYYLLAIAEKSVSNEILQQANQLAKQSKQDAAVQLIMNGDIWVKERYNKLKNESDISSVEEIIALNKEIESKANEIRANLNEEMKSGFREHQTFFKMASKRSCTMVKNTLAMSDQSPNTPIALIIGAAHTSGVINLLKTSQASYAVISPLSLVNNSKALDLSVEAYKLKLDKKSVDPINKLGAYLNGRRKPSVVLGERWLQAKSEIYLAISLLAGAAGGGRKPPFEEIASELDSFKDIKIDPTSYELIKKGNSSVILFKATASVDNNRTVDLWVGGWMEQPPGPPTKPPSSDGGMNDPNGKKKPSLEKMIEKMITEGRKQKTPSNETTIKISDNIKATFAKSAVAVKEAVEKG